MTTFDERERAFEEKFAHDANLKFLAEARRNKLVGTWAAAKLGLTGSAVDDYVKAVRKADTGETGGRAVFRRLKADFAAKSVAVSDAEIDQALARFTAEAANQVESGLKS